LRKISGPTRKEVERGWGKKHTEANHNLHCLPSVLSERDGACGMHKTEEKCSINSLIWHPGPDRYQDTKYSGLSDSV